MIIGKSKVSAFSIMPTVIVLVWVLLPAVASAETSMLITSIETTAEFNRWGTATGTRAMSTDHATEGTYSVRFDYGQVSPQFIYRPASAFDISSYRKLKFDVYLEGTPTVVNASFKDASNKSYTFWHYLFGEGHHVIEYSIEAMASEIDTSQFNYMTVQAEDPYEGDNQATIYIDNMRATGGTDDDSWLENTDPGEPLITVPCNVLQNGDFEYGFQNWGTWGEYAPGSYIFDTGSGDNVKSGIASAAIICQVGPGRGGISQQVDLEPGTYELTYWLKASAAGTPYVRARHYFYILEGDLSGPLNEYIWTVPTTWTEYTYTITANSQTTTTLYLYSIGVETIYIDAVSLDKLTGGCPDPPDPSLWTPKIVTLEGQKTLVDGEPFFPIGIYHAEPDELGGTGFNMVVTAVSSTSVEYLDDCHDNGLLTWMNLTGLARGHLPFQAGLIAESLKNHPALLCWFNCDEPDHPLWSVPPPEVRYISTKIAEVDANHPSSVLVMPWYQSTMYQYDDSTDIVMTDSYNLTISAVIDEVDTLRDTAGPDKPLWMALRFVLGGDPEPSSGYLYATTYGAITHTANGVLWFAYDSDTYPAAWNTLVDITLELEEISPALAADTSQESVSVSNSNIHTILKEYDKKFYLITVNLSGSTINGVSLNIPDTYSSQAEVKFEGRTETIAAGAITDNFAPYERHVYVFNTTDVDFYDYAVLASHYKDDACSGPGWCDDFDFDKSGTVDMSDVAQFAEYWVQKYGGL